MNRHDHDHHHDHAAQGPRDRHTRPDDDDSQDELRRRGFPKSLRLVFLAVVLGVALYRLFQGAG